MHVVLCWQRGVWLRYISIVSTFKNPITSRNQLPRQPRNSRLPSLPNLTDCLLRSSQSQRPPSPSSPHIEHQLSSRLPLYVCILVFTNIQFVRFKKIPVFFRNQLPRQPRKCQLPSRHNRTAYLPRLSKSRKLPIRLPLPMEHQSLRKRPRYGCGFVWFFFHFFVLHKQKL